MAAQPPQTKILNAAARAMLRPLGVTQKGRSRLWLDDQQWYVTVIEFQPFRGAQGSCLNVGVHWLWYPQDHWSFDMGYRISDFYEYHNDEQFTEAASNLVQRSIVDLRKYRDGLRTLESAHEFVWSFAFDRADDPWTLLHKGLISGLVGRFDETRSCFDAALDGPQEFDYEQDRSTFIRDLALHCDTIGRFRNRVCELIHLAREELSLPQVDVNWH